MRPKTATKITKTSKLPTKGLRRLTKKEQQDRKQGILQLTALFKALGYDVHLVRRLKTTLRTIRGINNSAKTKGATK